MKVVSGAFLLRAGLLSSLDSSFPHFSFTVWLGCHGNRNFSEEFYHAARNQIVAQLGWLQPTAETLPFCFSHVHGGTTTAESHRHFPCCHSSSDMDNQLYMVLFFFYCDTSLQPCDGLEPWFGIDTFGIASGRLETADVWHYFLLINSCFVNTKRKQIFWVEFGSEWIHDCAAHESHLPEKFNQRETPVHWNTRRF